MLILGRVDTTSINGAIIVSHMIRKVNGNYQNMFFISTYIFVDKIPFTLSFCGFQWNNTVFPNVRVY